MNRLYTFTFLTILAIVGWVGAFTAGQATTSQAAGETSCAQIAYQYVKQVAQTQHLKITYYKLQACHQIDADHSVARAEVNVSYYGLVQDVVLVYHLTKSAWQISDVHPVG